MRVLLAAALLLAACSSSPVESSVEPTGQVRVGLTDFEITSSAPVLVDGDVTMKVTNAGATAHDLRIVGRAVDAHVPLLAPGESTSLTLDVGGEQQLRLWCTVPGHRAQGMEHTQAVDG